jgi:hypothetical protein
MGEVTNAGYDGGLLYSAGNPTLQAAAHVRGTTHRDTPTADKVTTHESLVAGRHVAFRTKGAG